MTLKELIRAEIAAAGPMRLDRYMALCLGHPRLGYYMTRDPLGAAGDFITAPEISQMFGELIGLWVASRWERVPKRLLWVELGPGRGTLTADALRAIRRAAPGLAAALEVWMVETSPVLRAAQERAVPEARHVARLADLPEGPAAFVANEFFDALPIRQFVRSARGWTEKMLRNEGDGLGFALAPAPGAGPEGAPEGAVLERSPDSEAIAASIGARIAEQGGLALAIDYGGEPPATGGGDTFQAMRAHRFVDPLETPGEADLTAHVDFAALAAAFRRGGATPAPLLGQGDFLRGCGLHARAGALAAAQPDRAARIAADAARLAADEAMGRTFRALRVAGKMIDIN